MAFDPILTAEDSMNYQVQAPRTGVDVGLNLLAQYIRTKKAKKDDNVMKEEIAAILETTDNAERLKLAGGSSNPQLRAWALNQALGGEEKAREYAPTTQFVDTKTDKGTGVHRVTFNPNKNATEIEFLGESFKETPEDKYSNKLQFEKDKKDLEISSEKEQKSISNEKAINIWDATLSNIKTGFDGATTNPIAGMMPAITQEQQEAEASLEIAVPQMKQFFREKGEGNFTEGDQKIIIKLLPTRSDYPEVREKKLQIVDTIVRLKLGQPVGGLTGEDAEAALWANDPKNYESDAAKAIRQQLGL